MVIEAAVQPRVLAPFSHERDQTLAAIRGAHATDLPNRLGEAVRTARALVGQDAQAEIHVFTDGAHPAALRGQADDVRGRWVGVGQGGRNVAITNLAVRRNYIGAFDSQAFVSFVNFSNQPESFSFSLTLDSEVRRAVVLPFSHTGGGVLRARLNVTDDLATDDVAYAVIAPARTFQVLLVSPGNLFLEKELSTDPQVKLEVRKPDAYQGGMETFDVLVLDGVSHTMLGPGRFVLVNT